MKPLQLLHIVIQTPKGDISREQIKHLIYGMSIYRAVFLLELANYDMPVKTCEMSEKSQKYCNHRYLAGWKSHDRFITKTKYFQITNPHSYHTYVLTDKGREEAREIEANLQQMIDNVSNQNRKIA
jgi:hypothetical protein